MDQSLISFHLSPGSIKSGQEDSSLNHRALPEFGIFMVAAWLEIHEDSWNIVTNNYNV